MTDQSVLVPAQPLGTRARSLLRTIGTEEDEVLAKGLWGREIELQLLRARVDGLNRNGASTLAITGEPGIGKTELLAELARLAQTRRLRTVSGRATERDQALPYAVLARAFRKFLASVPGGLEHAGHDASHVNDLLARAVATDSAQLATEVAPYEAHRAMRAMIERLAADGAFVLLLDDLQWTDKASTAMLASLILRPPDAPVLLAFAARTGRLPAELDVALALAEASEAATRMVLTPLSSEVTDDALRLVFGVADRRWLDSEAGGNPFCLRELARHTVAAPPSPAGGVVRFRIPLAVSVAVRRELQSLGPRTCALLRAGATAGDPFDARLAAGVAGSNEDELLSAIDNLVAIDLLRQSPTAFAFAFRNPLVRRAVYDTIPIAERARMHAAIARTLAIGGASASAQAIHLESAATLGDMSAIATLRAAAQESLLSSPSASARWLQAARAFVPADRCHDALRLELFEQQAEASSAAGCPVDASELYAQAVNLGSRTAERQSALIARWAAAQRDHATAITLLRRALATATPANVVLGAELELKLATALALGDSAWSAVDLEDARQHAEHALPSDARAQPPGLEALAASVRSAILAQQGAASRAIELRDHAASIFRSMPPAVLHARIDGLFALIRTDVLVGDFSLVTDHVQTALRASPDARRTSWDGYLRVTEMRTHRELGREGELRGSVTRVAELLAESSDPVLLHHGLLQSAWSWLHLGQLDRARRASEEATELNVRSAYPFGHQCLEHAVVGILEQQLGDALRGYELIVTALGGTSLDRLSPLERAKGCEYLVTAALVCDDTRSADSWMKRAIDHAAHVDSVYSNMYARRAEAQIALAQQAPEAAIEGARAALGLAEALRIPPDIGIATHYLGRALAAAGETSQGVATLAAAAAIFRQTGAVLWEQRNVRTIERLVDAGVRHRPELTASGLDSLTMRESEVAGLVAARLTNRQIAHRLFLSEKTVETHLRNVFSKLGVNSRIAVAHTVERSRDRV